jgi:hypothetical protein
MDGRPIDRFAAARIRPRNPEKTDRKTNQLHRGHQAMGVVHKKPKFLPKHTAIRANPCLGAFKNPAWLLQPQAQASKKRIRGIHLLLQEMVRNRIQNQPSIARVSHKDRPQNNHFQNLRTQLTLIPKRAPKSPETSLPAPKIFLIPRRNSSKKQSFGFY